MSWPVAFVVVGSVISVCGLLGWLAYLLIAYEHGQDS